MLKSILDHKKVHKYQKELKDAIFEPRLTLWIKNKGPQQASKDAINTTQAQCT